MLYFLGMDKNKEIQIYLRTYREMLNDISPGLFYLVNDDLKIKNMSREGKISYLRKLQMLHMRNERIPDVTILKRQDERNTIQDL